VVVAYVVLDAGAELLVDDLRRHVRQSVAAYKVPRDFIVVDELPLNASGKVLKTDLRSRPV
jgi:fatty-acyl-CoA synthase